MIGFWMRCLGFYHYKFLYFGQSLLAIGYPFIWDMPQKLSNAWFPLEERNFSLFIGTSTKIVGCCLGCAMSIALIPKTNDRAQDAANIEWLLKIEAVCQTIVCFLVVCFFKPIYQNKWGQYATQKEELSDCGNSIVMTMEEVSSLNHEKILESRQNPE